MILYHFCAAHMLPSIRENGLTLGKYPIFESPINEWPKCQWLTSNKDPKAQSWATRHLIPYSRTAYRITVRVPDSYHKKLIQAVRYAMNLPEKDRAIVTEWPGSENWYVYLGKIPPKWIIGCKRMEKSA